MQVRVENISRFCLIWIQLDLTTGRKMLFHVAYGNLHFLLKMRIYSDIPGPTVFFKRRARVQRKSKCIAVFSTPSFIIFSSEIETAVIVFRYCVVLFFFRTS